MNSSSQTNRSTRNRRQQRQCLFGIVLLAALLRLIGLAHFSLWYDEGASLYLGHYVNTPTALFDASQNIEPPANALMTGLWAGLISMLRPTVPTDATHDFLLRLLPWFFGLLNCLLVYRLTWALYRSPQTALYAAFLFAIAPFQIYYAQELRIYSLYTTLSLLAVWSMTLALSKNRFRYWAAYVASLTLLMYSHYFSMWLIFTLNVAYVALLGKYRKLLWRWTGANALLMLFIAPALYRAFVMHANVQDLEIPWYPSPTWKTGLITFKTFFAGYGPRAWAYWPLFLLTLGLWAGGMRWKAHRTATILIACLTWLPIVGGIWLWGRSGFSFYEHRLFLFSGVAALIGVARGITLLGRPGLAALGCLTLLTLPCLSDYYHGRLHPIEEHRIAIWNKVDFRTAARKLEAAWQPGDRLIYTSHFSAYPMFHYFPRNQVRVGWGKEDETVFIQTMGHEAILRNHHLMPVPKEEAIAGASRIWLLTTHGITFEWKPTTERIRGWLDSIATEEERLEFKGVTLVCYVLKATAPRK